MNLIAINGSPRPQGNTSLLLETVCEPLEAAGISTRIVQLAGSGMRGCTACMKCVENKNRRCIIDSDPLNDILQKMYNADGVLLGSPTYFADVTAEMKAFIDRSGFVCRANGHLLRRKVGAGVVAVRRGGSMHALQTLQNYFLINEVIVPGSSYWNIAYGRNAGEVANDTEGMDTMRRLGENIAWLMDKVCG
ncbi:flavodoxin family protein [Pelovirga terrestris]|uniref:Flavodoxin family protein n=1 Tax=Pelovirga terrestris TaxID=2771352 RepID=A0A8J6QUU0_9BACT|nr:flavodoxin family protein [Pelovirga terrestris]MBD1400745.1 flavodoxin family protein [Pelovirga terrestris]